MNSSETFARPDTAVMRLGHIYPDQPAGFGIKRIHVGETIAPHIDQLRSSSAGLGKTPRTAGNLILTYARVALLPDLGEASDSTKVGPAIVTAELVDNLAIVAINHADNRYDSRKGCVNVVSLIGEAQGAACDHLDQAMRFASTEPEHFIEALHRYFGDDVPAELEIGAFGVFDDHINEYVMYPRKTDQT